MAERWITPPPDVSITHPDTGLPVDDEATRTARWPEIMLRLLAHPKLCGTTPMLKSNNLLRRGFKAAQVGVPYNVPEEDWARLTGVLNDPDDVGGRERATNALSNLVRLIPSVLPQLEDFFTAWTDAPSKRPEPRLEPIPPAPQLPPAAPADAAAPAPADAAATAPPQAAP